MNPLGNIFFPRLLIICNEYLPYLFPRWFETVKRNGQSLFPNSRVLGSNNCFLCSKICWIWDLQVYEIRNFRVYSLSCTTYYLCARGWLYGERSGLKAGIYGADPTQVFDSEVYDGVLWPSVIEDSWDARGILGCGAALSVNGVRLGRS